MLSKFSLVGGKYLFHDERCVAVFSNTRYARPVQSQLESLEVEDGSEVALKVLVYLTTESDIREHIRLPTPGDLSAAQSNVKGPDTKFGNKRTCLKCSQVFYDLRGKVRACPKCKTQIVND